MNPPVPLAITDETDLSDSSVRNRKLWNSTVRYIDLIQMRVS